MLKWFAGRKPGHPWADLKQAEELLTSLPASDPPRALEEITRWAESVVRSEELRLANRIGLIRQLDDAGQPFHRKVLRDYLAAPRAQKQQEQRLWTAAFHYWRQLTAGYAACLAGAAEGTDVEGRHVLPLAVCRGIRAVGQQLKWLQLRYGPIDDDLWAALSAFYRFALERTLEGQAADLHSHVTGATDPDRELVKVLMLWAAAPDTLPPELFEIAERLTAHFSPQFEIGRSRRGSTCHAFDLDGNRGPGRLGVAASVKRSMILFGAGAALDDMEQVRAHLERGALPPEIDLGGIYRPGAVLEALNHLIRQWAPNPPERRHLRHRVQARLAVINGLDRLVEEIVSSGNLGLAGIESWLIEDISASGFRATFPEMRPDWIRIGALVGIRPEGVERWGVGIIRRLARDRQNQGYVGVQTMAHEAVSVRLRPTSGRWGSPLKVDAQGCLPALRLKEFSPVRGEIVLAARSGFFSMHQGLEILGEAAGFHAEPLALMERGEEFEIARFRETRTGSR